MHNNHPFNRYLVMPNERVHPAEGGIEGREPIGRLFRDIKENLCTIHNSLFLR